MIPVSPQRPTLAGTGEEDARGPRAHETVQAEGELLEARDGEDAAVEADDGDFDDGAEDKIEELV